MKISVFFVTFWTLFAKFAMVNVAMVTVAMVDNGPTFCLSNDMKIVAMQPP